MTTDQLHVFLEYTKRFELIAQEFPIGSRELEDPIDQSMQEKKYASSEAVQHAVHRYFNLCSEEFYLHRIGLITDETWAFWIEGMKYFMASNLFATLWRKGRGGYATNAEFQEFIDGLLGTL